MSYLKWLSKGIPLNYVNMDYVTFTFRCIYDMYFIWPPWTIDAQVYCVGSGTMEILGETSSKPMSTQFNQGKSLEDSRASLWKCFIS